MSGHLDCNLKQGHEKTVSCLKKGSKRSGFCLKQGGQGLKASAAHLHPNYQPYYLTRKLVGKILYGFY